VLAYWKFESISLQRRVRCEPISPAGGAERQAAFGINELLTTVGQGSTLRAGNIKIRRGRWNEDLFRSRPRRNFLLSVRRRD